MRSTFIEELISHTASGANTALIVGDLGYGVVEIYKNLFPQRFFNAGVAEASMMGLASGLASEGIHVFVYSIANFPTFRCAEQIRNDVDYHNLPVTIVAVGGGLSYGNLGYSHHAIQDYALVRSLPNMLIASPGDHMETKACMQYLINNPQPSYLRLGKATETNIHNTPPTLHPGKWCPVRALNTNKNCYLTTGSALSIVNCAITDESAQDNWDLFSMPLWGMKYKNTQIAQVGNYEKIMTVEDHLYDGGFGSWMLEATNEDKFAQAKIDFLALDPKICGMVGKQLTLNNCGGLTKENICK
jgi:transketolase